VGVDCGTEVGVGSDVDAAVGDDSGVAETLMRGKKRSSPIVGRQAGKDADATELTHALLPQWRRGGKENDITPFRLCPSMGINMGNTNFSRNYPIFSMIVRGQEIPSTGRVYSKSVRDP
jgi:hypothetical protein